MKIQMKILKLLSLPLLFSGLALISLLLKIPEATVVSKEPLSLEKVDFTSDMEGLYVTGTISYIYDCYCEEVKNESITRREYIIDADNNYYMGLRADGNDIAAADALLKASYNYYIGNENADLITDAQYSVTGVIEKIPDDTINFYQDYLNQHSISVESQEKFLPYYLRVTDYKAEVYSDMFLSVSCLLIGVIISIIILICFRKSDKS